MKPRLLVQMIVRNEEKRYLKEVLDNISKSADEIIILDDSSTDRTIEICKSFKKVYLELNDSDSSLFEENESSLRSRLWELARKRGVENDWVLTLDADEVFDENFHQSLSLLLTSSYDWISFHLLDMWNRKEYRVDGYWSPIIARLFRFKNIPYNIKGEIHCKNIPRYVYETNNGCCRSDIILKHLGYLREEDRQKKYDFYSKKSIGLDYLHTMSIKDDPKLKRITDTRYKTILMPVLVRNRDWCLRSFLEGIFELEYPKELIIPYFIVNDSTDQSLNILKDWKNLVKNYYSDIVIEEKNFGNVSLKDHDWDDQKLYNMSVMRNMYIAKAKELKSDYVFAIDSDVLIKNSILLKHLINLDRDVVAELHFAKWEKFNSQLPNTWIQGQYDITEKFIELLKRPSCYPVGGVCGCTLISKNVIDAGVDYSRIYNLPQEIRGEDRFFCINAQSHKFTVWCDTCYPCEHIERLLEDRIKDIKKKVNSSISLCMIVRNEEEYIGQSISSVKAIVDDIVVVDTGSDDKTESIAKESGAIVLKEKWNNDFSEVRNKSLRKAKGDWIFRIDADEYILPEDQIRILELVKDKSIDAYLFPIKSFLEDPVADPKAKCVLSESFRLFRNSKDIYYTGIVHEEIEESLLKLKNPKVKATDIYIWHFGYLKNKEFVKQKHKYYSELYKERLKKNPNDIEAMMSLALHSIYGDKLEIALDFYMKVLNKENNWRAYNNIGVIRREEGDRHSAIKYFKMSKENIPDNVNPLYKQKVEENLIEILNRNLLSDIIA